MQQASDRDAFLLAALVAVTQHLPSGVAVLDATGHVVLVNEPAEAWLGLHTADPRPWTEQVAGHTVRAQLGGRIVAIAEWPLARALVGEAVLGWKARLRSTDGHVDNSVVVSAVPLRDPAGRLTGAVGIFADGSRRRRVALSLSPRDAS